MSILGLVSTFGSRFVGGAVRSFGTRPSRGLEGVGMVVLLMGGMQVGKTVLRCSLRSALSLELVMLEEGREHGRWGAYMHCWGAGAFEELLLCGD